MNVIQSIKRFIKKISSSTRGDVRCASNITLHKNNPNSSKLAELILKKGLNAIRNIKMFDVVDDSTIKSWIEQIIEFRYSREVISKTELGKFFPDKSKENLRYIEATISNTINFIYEFEEERFNNLNLDWYIWNAKSCEKHKHMDEIVNNYNTPVSANILKDKSIRNGIHPGQTYRCLCIATPIISWKYQITPLRAPIKVHINGEICKTGKREFKKMSKINDF